MVNSDAFAERLKKILEYYTISASSFAEKLQIQRSSISHIISGRNKPSLDFVLKVVHAFPEVDLYWLLNGKGVFPKENQSTSTLFSNIDKSDSDNSVEIKKSDKAVSEEIERIVVFYKNGTFKNYTP